RYKRCAKLSAKRSTCDISPVFPKGKGLLSLFVKRRNSKMIHPIYPSSNEGEEQCARKQNADIWGTLQKVVPEMREQRLAFLLFNCGLKPREIVSHCPQEFCDVQE